MDFSGAPSARPPVTPEQCALADTPCSDKWECNTLETQRGWSSRSTTPATICPESLLPDCVESVNPIIYSDLDAECILQAALHTQGAAGLSGLDAFAWRRLCSSFKSTSHDLCHALAAVGRRICFSNIHPDDLSAFVSCRLNKTPV